MSKHYRIMRFWGFLLCSILILILFQNNNHIITQNLSDKQNYNIDKYNLKVSGYWESLPIVIDDSDPNYNWSKTAIENDWCLGSGNWSDPYIIENVTINGNNSGSCLTILHSTAYFKIKNCTFYNSSSLPFDAGILLNNVSNGKLINNTCSNNTHGIRLSAINNVTIIDNIVNYNNKAGIYLENGYSNIISGNTVNNNSWSGMFLRNSNNNNISENTANGNKITGIYLDYSENNNISGNTVNRNVIAGIFLEISDNNSITGNNVKYNNKNGINLRYSNNNIVSGNILAVNEDYKCIIEINCKDNIIENNNCEKYNGVNDGNGNGNGNGNNDYNRIVPGYPIMWIIILLITSIGIKLIINRNKINN